MKRILRGSIVLYTLKFSFIAVVLLVQACQDTATPEDPVVRFNSFLASERNVIVEGLYTKKGGQANLEFDQTITEQEARELLVPTLNESKILLDHYGFQDNEFIEELGVVDETVKIYTALAVLEAERLFNNGNTYIASSLFFNQAIAEESVATCILEALGVGALYDWAVGKA